MTGIFGEPVHNGTATSAAAARSMKPHAGALRQKIIDLIALSPEGATCDDIEARTDMRHQTASARIRELALLGRIYQSGERKTRSGRKAAVWKMKVISR